MIVPTLLIYASPGPASNKKPAARRYMVRSVRKECVAWLRSQDFFWEASSGSVSCFDNSMLCVRFSISSFSVSSDRLSFGDEASESCP